MVIFKSYGIKFGHRKVYIVRLPKYIMEKQTTKCSHCKSENVIKWCKRKTQNRGLIQRYKCKDCNNTFTLDVWEEAQHGKTITLPNRIIKPRLCQDCISGYNNIINNANKEIKEYLEIKEPKKKIVFGKY